MKKKITSIIAVSALIICTVFSGTDILRAQAKEPGKEESVSVKTDAQGEPYRVTVENTLAVSQVKGEIRDVSYLSDIRNKNGDEEYRTEQDGVIIWDNHGVDILYEGDADVNDLPVAVHISYYLNGRKVAPEDIAGASGKVKIRFDYENKTKGDDYVPFLFLSAALLETDVFSDVEAENGSVSRMDDYLIVTGFVFPGLRDALKLDAYEKTEGIDIPEYLEIEAEAEEFSLAFTVTMVMNGMFEDIELDGLDDLDDMLDGMDELRDATKELADGALKLKDGAGTFRDGLVSYTNGAGAVADGAKAVNEGLATVNANMGQLTQGAGALAGGLAQLNEGLSKVDLSALTGGNATQMKAISDAAAAVAANGQALGTALANLQTQLSGLDVATLTQSLTDAGNNLAVIGQQAASLQGSAGSLQAQAAALDAQIAAQGNTVAALGSQAVYWEVQINELTTAGDTSTATGAKAAAEQAKTEAETVQAGLANIRDNLLSVQGELAAEAGAIAAAAAAQGTALQSLQNSLAPLASIDTSDLTKAANGLQQGLQTLAPYMQSMSGMGDQMKALSGSVSELKSGVSQLASGAAALSQGVSQLAGGMGQLADGAKQLSDGATALSSNGRALVSGYDSLYDGIGKFADGLQTFHNETADAFADMETDALQDIFDALRTVKAADNAYTTFSGAADGYRSSVKFVFETDAVKR